MAISRVAAVALLLGSAPALAADPFFPLYHVRPAHNWVNDPNGPFYDARHSLYHLFLQYNPHGSVWGNMSWAHLVSSDLVFWNELPVALFNDQDYDIGGVFTGSVTVVQGTPVAIYTCVTPEAERQCIARSLDPSDPLLLSWIKDPFNPVIRAPPPGAQPNDFRDDTTAWYSEEDQAWLWGVGTNVNGTGSIALYSTPAFGSSFAYNYSNLLWQGPPGSGMWECPDFFAVDDAAATHPGLYAAKRSSGGRDWITLGGYDSLSRTFSPGAYADALVDLGHYYASKSFFDPASKRRVIWGWVSEEDSDNGARGWQGMQALPRVISYNAVVDALDFSPLPELSSLRTGVIGSQGVTTLPSGGQLVHLALSNSTLQLEVDAYFALLLPVSSASSLELGVAVGVSPSGASNTRISFLATPASGPLNNTDLPGGDMIDIGMDPALGDGANAANCSALCNATRGCVAWTFVRAGTAPSPPYPDCRCSLKSSIPAPSPGKSCCISGTPAGSQLAVNRTASGTSGDASTVSGAVTLASGTTIIRLHVFVDGSIVEGFLNGGRAAITSRVYSQGDRETRGVAVYAAGNNAISLINATVWQLGSMALPAPPRAATVAAPAMVLAQQRATAA